MNNMTIEEMRAVLKDLETKQNEITKALKVEEEKEAKLKKQKLEEEKEERRALVCAKLEDAEKELREYIRDYGSFVRSSQDSEEFFPSYLFHNFLF